MSLLRTIGQKFPAVQTIEQSLSSATRRPIEQVRADLWRSRAEFWIRRSQNVPIALRAARTEAQQLWANKITQTGTWTFGDLAGAAVVGTQLAGCFCIGEILARGRFTGYPQGSEGGHH